MKNVVIIPISVIDLYCGFFPKLIIEYPVDGRVGLYCAKSFLRSIFCQKELDPPFSTFLNG